jgi:hypothetical protein
MIDTHSGVSEAMPDMIFMAGAYGSLGSLTLIASAFHG